jgi:hypothetical protein
MSKLMQHQQNDRQEQRIENSMDNTNKGRRKLENQKFLRNLPVRSLVAPNNF